jgi:integrase
LPVGVTFRHGSYYLRREGKWTNLGPDLSNALHRYAATHIQPHRPTFADLIKRFEAAALAPERYKPNTIRSYRCWLKPLNSVFGPQPLEDFRQQDVHAYRTAHPQKVTANRHVQLLGTLLAYAVEIGWLPSSPMTGYKRPKSATEQSRKRTVQPDEWDALLKAADPVMLALLKVARVTALRVSDLVRLRWEDVKADGLHVRPQKTDRARDGYGVPMVFSTDGELGGILAEMKRQPVRNLIWLFPNKRGRQMSVTTAEHRFAELRKDAGVSGLWLHDIRRTRITEIIDKYGRDAGQRIAGHLDAKSTAGYYAPDAIRIEGF